MQQRVFDRPMLLALLLAAAIVVPRSWHMAANSSPAYDDQYHIQRGLWMLGAAEPQTLNDPPLGEAIVALPLRLLGVRHASGDANPLFHQPISASTILRIVAVWKAILLVPAIGVAFHWCRRIYGTRAGWLAAALLTFEPTIAAHTPLAALDVLAMEAVLLSVWLLWRYVQAPSRLNLTAAAAGLAVALLTKHTALPMAAVAVVVVLQAGRRAGWPARRILNQVASGTMLTFCFLWALTGFDISPPRDVGSTPGIDYLRHSPLTASLIETAVSSRWPAGCYLGSVLGAIDHVRGGQDAFLLGQHNRHGWWYYHFVVAMYKVPVGVAAILLLGAISLAWHKPRRDELALAIPIVGLGLLLMAGGVSTGFRHALPAYGLALLLACRCAANAAPPPATIIAWAGAAATAIHSLSYHPNYLPYLNAPWPRPWLAISDSNLDWGTSLPAVRRWIDAHAPGRTVWLDAVDVADQLAIREYVGDRVRIVGRSADAPRDGLLVVSPWWVAGLYQSRDQYRFLRDRDPDDIIARSLLVFDLDRLASLEESAAVDSAGNKPQNYRQPDDP